MNGLLLTLVGIFVIFLGSLGIFPNARDNNISKCLWLGGFLLAILGFTGIAEGKKMHPVPHLIVSLCFAGTLAVIQPFLPILFPDSFSHIPKFRMAFQLAGLCFVLAGLVYVPFWYSRLKSNFKMNKPRKQFAHKDVGTLWIIGGVAVGSALVGTIYPNILFITAGAAIAFLCLLFMSSNESDESKGTMVMQQFDEDGQMTIQNQKDFEPNFNQFMVHLQNSGLEKFDFSDELISQYKEVFNFFNPRDGWIGTYFRQGISEKQKEIVQNMTETQRILLAQVTNHISLIQQHKQTTAKFYFMLQEKFHELKQIKNNIDFAERSMEKGFLPPDYSQLNLQKEIAELEIDKYKRQKEIDLAHEIAMDEHLIIKTDERTVKKIKSKKTDAELHLELEEAIKERKALRERTDLPEEDKQELLEVKQAQIDYIKRELHERYPQKN